MALYEIYDKSRFSYKGILVNNFDNIKAFFSTEILRKSGIDDVGGL